MNVNGLSESPVGVRVEPWVSQVPMSRWSRRILEEAAREVGDRERCEVERPDIGGTGSRKGRGAV